MVIVFFIAVVLVVRCVRCICTGSCRNSLSLFLDCRGRTVNVGSFTESASTDNSGVHNTETPKQHCPSSTPKLEELEEEDLLELKRILGLFLNYHDESDWTIFTSSCTQQNVSSNAILQRDIKLKVSMKIVLVGNPNVGKTSIFHRIIYDSFSEYYMATLGVDLGIVTLHLFPDKPDSVLILLQVWDIAGSEKFSELSHIIYKDANAYVLICDVTAVNVMDYAIPWIRDIQSAVCQPHVSLFFNKIDDKENALALVINRDLYTFDSYCVSAKTGENVLKNLVIVVAKSLLSEAAKHI